jgi:hypothetical protein
MGDKGPTMLLGRQSQKPVQWSRRRYDNQYCKSVWVQLQILMYQRINGNTEIIAKSNGRVTCPTKYRSAVVIHGNDNSDEGNGNGNEN